MGANFLPSLFSTSPSLLNNKPLRTQTLLLPSTKTRLPRISNASTGGNNGSSDESPPPDTIEIRFRRGSRKRARQQEKNDLDRVGLPPPPPPKDWESMTLGEKAVELYMGEKGLLFWLNKFAYASIFIIIGGWILFRFVGPSLGLYQLDAPPLSPTSILKGS